MARIMGWIARHPALSFILALLITFSFSGGFANLRVDPSTEGMMIPDDPDVVYYRDIVDTFGGVVQSIVVRSDDLFSERVLTSIEELTYASGGLDGVLRVVSLFTVTNLKGEEGILYTDPLLTYVPSDEAELAQAREDAISNELLIGEVINPEGTATAIHLFLESRPDDIEFEPRLIAEIDALIAAERERVGDDVILYQIGNPTVKQFFIDATTSDTTKLGAAGVVAVGIALLLFFRAAAAAVVPIVTGAFSVVATLGFMGLMGYPIDSTGSIIPILLVVIGCTEDIHILAEYAVALRRGLEKKDAVREMAIKSGLAIFLTSLTTFVAFATIAPNPIPMLHRFGMAASFGLLINFLLTILLVPTILRIMPVPKAFKSSERESLLRLRQGILTATTRHQRSVNLVTLTVAVLAVLGCFRLVVNTDYLSFFREDSEIKNLFYDVSENLTGATTFMVVVDTGEPDGIKDPGVLADIEKLTDYLGENFEKTVGYVDFLRKIHMEINEGDPAFRHVPESPELIAQYTLLMNPDDLDRFVDFDMAKAAIIVRTSNSGSQEVNAATAGIYDFVAAKLSRDLDIHVTGETILINQASDDMSRGLITNLYWVAGAIFIFISILFLSPKAGLMAMVPNALPALVTFGFMGWSGIPLSTTTFSVVIIALGIAVDDTIHFMVSFSKHMKESSDNEEVLKATLTHELRPVLVTSVVLMVGFSMLMLGELASSFQFGILAVLAMAAAFLSDLFVTPVLLQAVPLISAWDLLKLSISDEVIAKSPLFVGLKPGEVKRLALLGELRTFAKGEHIIRQGDTGKDLLVFLQGTGRTVIHDDKTGRETELEIVETGSVVGEIALCLEGKRTASVIATGDVETLSIDGARLERMTRRFPAVSAKLFQNISALLGKRLSTMTRTYAESS